MGAEAAGRTPPAAAYRFDRFTLDLARGALLAEDGTELPLRPKSFALLELLVGNAGRLLDRNTIMAAVWPNVVVGDEAVTQCVRDIRKALGDQAQHLLRTVPKRGYLFAVEVARAELAPDARPDRPQQQPITVAGAPPLPLAHLEHDPGRARPGDARLGFAELSPRSGGVPARTRPATLAPTADAERRQVTVLICDLVGSTKLCEQLEAEDFSSIIRVLLETCTAVITRCRGHVAGYMGDGVLAYFGYPEAREDAAERAVRAGLAVVEEIGRLRPGPDLALQVRVSIATGLVVNDRLGEAAHGLMAVGKPLNLAARLQAAAEPGTVVIADSTRSLVGGLFALEDLGQHLLKDFAAPIRTWRVTGEGTAASRFKALRGSSLTPMIGRGHELSLLLDRWQQARNGEGQVVLLAGEAGIGKSRLVQALRDRLAGEARADLGCQCSPHHRDSPLQPVIAHLQRAAGLTDGDGPGEKLEKLETFLGQGKDDPVEPVPLFASLLSIPTDGRYPPLGMSPRLLRERTLAALVDRLAEVAVRRPVLLVWEDAHWADPTSLELLGLAFHRIRDRRVMAVVTFRPEFEPPWPGHTHATWLRLNRLGRVRCIEVVAGVTGGKPLPAAVLEQIVARAEGIPLFVEELTKAVLESRLLQEAREAYKLKHPLPPLAVPASLEDSLRARLDRLGPAKEITQVAAVIGREFSHRLLAAVASPAEVELAVALDRLVRAELVLRQGEPPQAVYSFKHALVRDAAYATLLRARRRELHGRVAEVLESSLPDVAEAQPELLGHHLTEAGRPEAAVQAWLLAGERAVARSALAEAESQFRKGLALLAVMPDGTWRRQRELDLQLALGRTLLATRGHAAPAMGKAYARARELCEQLERPPQLVPVLFGLCVHHLMRAELELSRGYADEMRRLGEERDDARLRLMGCRLAGQPELGLGEFTAARAHLEQGLALFDPADRPFYAALALQDARVMLLIFLSQALLCLGHPDRARRRWEEAVAEARQLNSAYSLAIALSMASILAVALAMVAEGGSDERSSALSLTEECTALSTEQGFAMLRSIGILCQGWCLTADGRAAAGLPLMDQGLAGYRAAGTSFLEPYCLVLLADAHAKAGQPEEGLRHLAEAERLIEATRERWPAAEVYRLKGELLARLGQPAAAEACLRRALATARRQEARLWELRAATGLARLWRDQGRSEQARDLLAPVCTWFTEGFGTPDARSARALLAAVGG